MRHNCSSNSGIFIILCQRYSGSLFMRNLTFLRHKPGHILYFSWAMNLILQINTSCAAKARYVFFHWALSLHCCPNIVTNTAMSPSVVFSDVSLHHYAPSILKAGYTHWFWPWANVHTNKGSTVSPVNQPRIEEALSTSPPNTERGVCSRVIFVMFATFRKRCYVKTIHP